MSFLDSIVDFGAGLLKNVTGSGVIGGVAKTAALGLLLKQVTESINKDNQKPTTATTNRPDPGVRLQVDPDTDHSIPVVYGQAYMGGIVTDAVLTNGNQTMWYCITLCEKTGNLINGTPSQISIDRVYWNESEIRFQSDGVTVQDFVSAGDIIDSNPNGLIKIYLYNNGSSSQTFPVGYTGAISPAYSRFPNWTANHQMNNLVFALVRIDYNRDKNVTGLGKIEFKIKNSMTEAGDVLNDYMTNTRYGAGIPAAEINR